MPETQPELLPPDSSEHDPTQSLNALRGLTQEILAKAVARSQIGEPSKDESSSDSEDDEDEVPTANPAKPSTANAEVLDRGTCCPTFFRPMPVLHLPLLVYYRWSEV